MKKLALVLGLFVFMLFMGTANAQMFSITCDNDTYTADMFGNIDIYCNITNKAGSTKNEKVSSIFDDINGIEVQIVDVLTKELGGSWTSIKPNLQQNKPVAGRTKQLSQQNIQTKAGETTQIHITAKVPLGSAGKFDIGMGDTILDPWWNSSWSYMQNFTVSYNGNYDLIDYQVKILLNSSIFNYSNTKTDGSDIRIVYNEDEYEIPVCRKNWTLNGFSEFWTKMNITANSSMNITFYYGNPSATDVNNCSNVFDFWENFSTYSNNTFPSDKWFVPFATGNNPPNVTCQNGLCYLESASYVPYGSNIIQTKSAFNVTNFSLTMKYNMVTEGNADGGTFLYYKNSNWSVCKYGDYPCGQLIFNHNYYNNINIISINSTAFVTLSTASHSDYNENNNRYQIRELRGEGNNLTAIFKTWLGGTIAVLNGFDNISGLTNNTPSHISIDQKYRYNKYYEIYLRKFTYNEPTVFPNAEEPIVPAILVSSPQNITYNASSVLFNASSFREISEWRYSLNGGANITFTPPEYVNASEGSNSVTFWGNDSITGLWGKMIVNFTVDSTSPDISWNTPANNSFTLNLTSILWNATVSEIPDNCILNINGTANYSMLISGNDCYYTTSNLTNQTTYCGLVYANDSYGNMNVSGLQCATVNMTSYVLPEEELAGMALVLSDAGTGLGGFLDALTNPLVQFMLALGFVSGIFLIVFSFVRAFDFMGSMLG